MYAVRLWATRHARGLQRTYQVVDLVLRRLDPLWRVIGYRRLERPLTAIEVWAKGFLFDCRMCGRCVLSATGMTCPMNCPKSIRNGPCGGVRPDGHCEIAPEMRCVWVEAWAGCQRMRGGAAGFRAIEAPVDNAIAGTSSWLRHLSEQGPELVALFRIERRGDEPTSG